MARIKTGRRVFYSARPTAQFAPAAPVRARVTKCFIRSALIGGGLAALAEFLGNVMGRVV
jgi:hypothetical protein